MKRPRLTVADFEVEQDEMSRANPPVYLTRELWVRLLEKTPFSTVDGGLKMHD